MAEHSHNHTHHLGRGRERWHCHAHQRGKHHIVGERAVTETEATHTAEPLPECETGSVERMLEAAIEWNEKLEPRNSTDLVGGLIVYECDVQEPYRITKSQTQLLRNILAKMRADDPPLNMRDVVCQYKLNDVQMTPEEAREVERKVLGREYAQPEAAPADATYTGPIVLHRSCPHCHGSISATIFRNEAVAHPEALRFWMSRVHEQAERCPRCEAELTVKWHLKPIDG